MAKITLSYLYNIFGSNILKIFNKDVKKILVFSPQRTFSNYFETFLEKNFFINFLNTTNEVKNYDSKIHKHILCPDLEYLKKYHSDCIIFVLYKNFELWLKSLEKNDQDFFDHFLPYHNIKIDRNDKIKLKQYYFNWYQNWLNIKNKIKNVELINHKQTLTIENKKKLFEYLKLKYKLYSKGKFNEPRKIRRSDSFDKNIYLNNIDDSSSPFEEYFQIIE